MDSEFMATGWKRIARAIVLTASSVVVVGGAANLASAQTVYSNTSPYPTISEQFNRTFFTYDKTFFENRRFPRSASWFLGLFSFPENEISGDGRVVNNLYESLLEQQVANDPTIRTPDLPNPFDASLLTAPLISEVNTSPAPVPYNRTTLQPAPMQAPIQEPVQQEAPIPALW